VSPDLLGLMWRELGNVGLDISWRDGVDTSKLDPFDSQTLACPNHQLGTLFMAQIQIDLHM